MGGTVLVPVLTLLPFLRKTQDLEVTRLATPLTIDIVALNSNTPSSRMENLTQKKPSLMAGDGHNMAHLQNYLVQF